MKAYPAYFSKDLLNQFATDETRNDIWKWLNYNAHDKGYVMVCEVDQYSLECEPYDFQTQPDPIVVKFLNDVLKEYGECRDHDSTLPSGGWKQIDIIVL